MSEIQKNLADSATNVEEDEVLQKVEALKKQEQEISERMGRIGGILDAKEEGKIKTFGDGFGEPHIAIDYISRGDEEELKKRMDKYMSKRDDFNKRLDEIYKSGDVYTKDHDGYSIWVDQKLRTDPKLQELLQERDRLVKQFEVVREERCKMENELKRH
jgi:hypothetical protein